MSRMRDIDRKTLLRALRLSAGMSQSDIAHDIGVTPTTVGNWEQGRNLPTGRSLTALLDLFEAKRLFKLHTSGPLAGITLTRDAVRDKLGRPTDPVAARGSPFWRSWWLAVPLAALFAIIAITLSRPGLNWIQNGGDNGDSNGRNKVAGIETATDGPSSPACAEFRGTYEGIRLTVQFVSPCHENDAFTLDDHVEFTLVPELPRDAIAYGFMKPGRDRGTGDFFAGAAAIRHASGSWSSAVRVGLPIDPPGTTFLACILVTSKSYRYGDVIAELPEDRNELGACLPVIRGE